MVMERRVNGLLNYAKNVSDLFISKKYHIKW